MIQPLRRRHRWMMATLAVLLPLALMVALRARPPLPRVEVLPAIAPAQPFPSEADAVALLESDDLWVEIPIRTRILQVEGSRWVELQPLDDPRLPELLLYWSAEPPRGQGLPAGAVLLGDLAGAQTRRFAWPSTASSREGTWILYSLGHGRVVASSQLIIGEG